MSEQMTQYQKDLVRMWDSLRVENKGAKNCSPTLCKQCPFNDVVCISDGYTGDNYTSILFNAEKAIEVANGWAKEHPFVTNEQKYKEDWGVEPRNETGVLCCPKYMGLLKDLSKCHPISGECEKCKEDFWNSEYKKPKKEGEES